MTNHTLISISAKEPVTELWSSEYVHFNKQSAKTVFKNPI